MFERIRRNESGLAMLQVIVVSFIVIGLMMFLLDKQKLSLKAAYDQFGKMEIKHKSMMISKFLSESRNCLHTFQYANSPMGGEGVISRIQGVEGVDFIKSQVDFFPSELSGISYMELSNIDTPNGGSGELKLTIEFFRKGSPNKVKRSLLLDATFDIFGNISTCRAQSFSQEFLAVRKDLCEDIGAVFDTSFNKCSFKGIQISDSSSAACTPKKSGTIRYVKGIKEIEFCSNGLWSKI